MAAREEPREGRVVVTANGTSTSPPYGAYASIMATFVGGVALTGAAASRRGRHPRNQTWFDLAVLGLATFKAARTLDRWRDSTHPQTMMLSNSRI